MASEALLHAQSHFLAEHSLGFASRSRSRKSFGPDQHIREYLSDSDDDETTEDGSENHATYLSSNESDESEESLGIGHVVEQDETEGDDDDDEVDGDDRLVRKMFNPEHENPDSGDENDLDGNDDDVVDEEEDDSLRGRDGDESCEDEEEVLESKSIAHLGRFHPLGAGLHDLVQFRMMHPIEYETQAVLDAIQSQMRYQQQHAQQLLLPSPSALRRIQTPQQQQQHQQQSLKQLQKQERPAKAQAESLESQTEATRKRARQIETISLPVPKKSALGVHPRRVQLLHAILEKLPRKHLKGVIDIVIAAGVCDPADEEFVFDVYSMDESVVRKLESFVAQVQQQNAKSLATTKRSSPQSKGSNQAPASISTQRSPSSTPNAHKSQTITAKSISPTPSPVSAKSQKVSQSPIQCKAVSPSANPSHSLANYKSTSPSSSSSSSSSSNSSTKSRDPIASSNVARKQPHLTAASTNSLHANPQSSAQIVSPTTSTRAQTPKPPSTKQSKAPVKKSLPLPKLRKDTNFTEQQRNAIFSTNEILKMNKDEDSSEDEVDVDI